MLEVCFDQSAWAMLKASQAEGQIHKDNDIIYLVDVLIVGKLNVKTIDERMNILKKLSIEINDNEFKQQYHHFIDKLVKAKEIRLWLGNSEFIGLCFVCYLFKHIIHTNSVIYAIESNEPLIAMDHIESLFNTQKIISIDQYAGIYEKLLHDNKDLRVIENGQLVSKDIDYFDDKIRYFKKKYPDSSDSHILSLILDDYENKTNSLYNDDVILQRIKHVN